MPEPLLPEQQSAYELPSAEMERLLYTGESPELLREYFGDAGYQELRELARQASSRAVRGGPRVLILPGIMGSTLGKRRKLLNNVIWFNPLAIIEGELIDLAINGPRWKYEALDVIAFFYTMLRLRLRLHGFDVDYHYYDWRFGVERLGQELAERLEQEPAAEIALVAHSMGGLVARAALAAGAGKVKRLIMLGTPNFGSFMPVLVLRGTYEMTQRLHRLDPHHSAQELTEQVLNTFASVYQMLPSAKKYTQIDLYRTASWPANNPRLRTELLTEAAAIEDKLAKPDERFCLIAGVNQETITDMSLGPDSDFVYAKTLKGDGTVPLDYAMLPSVPTYFVNERHGNLPNNGEVGEAVRDLLNTGTTKALDTSWTPSRAAPAVQISDAMLRAAVPFDMRRGQGITARERRQILASVMGPASPELPAAVVTPAMPAGTVPPPLGSLPAFRGVVVGRRRQHRLDFVLFNGSITDVSTRAYVLGVFQNVSPTGPARVIDDLLEGAVSDFVARRMFSAQVGQVFMIPAGRKTLRADMVLFAGLGHFDQFNNDVQQVVAGNVIRTLLRTGFDDFATVLFGAGSGQEPGVSLGNLLRGFFAGLFDADTAYQFRRVVLCELDPARYAQIKSELYRLASTDLFDGIEVTIDEKEPALRAHQPPAPASRLPGDGRERIYLYVRQTPSANDSSQLEATILTAGGKATVLSGVQLIQDRELDGLLASVGKSNFNLDTFGPKLAALVFTSDLLAVLGREEWKPDHLVIVHDAPASRIPWETLKLANDFPALQGGMSRRYITANLSIAKWLESRRLTSTLDILLVVNPTEDLDGADKEGHIISELFSDNRTCKLTKLTGAQATRDVLLQEFQSGTHDVVHYAGHAFFDPVHPERSGILCAAEQVLSGQDLAGLGHLPALVFFNACESGRIRKVPSPPHQRLRETVAFAEAFLRGGIANFVGTYWPVGDNSAKTFAKTFYTAVVDGKPIGATLLAARSAVRRLPSVDWADYIHYGDPDFMVKAAPP